MCATMVTATKPSVPCIKYLWNSLASLEVRPEADLFSSDIVFTPQHKSTWLWLLRIPRSGGFAAPTNSRRRRTLLYGKDSAGNRRRNCLGLTDYRPVALRRCRPWAPSPAGQTRHECDRKEYREADQPDEPARPDFFLSQPSSECAVLFHTSSPICDGDG